VPPELLNPQTGLLAAALIAIGVLWRAHVEADKDCKTDRDYWRDLALAGTELADKATTIAVRKR
jgi:hypothetical protein